MIQASLETPGGLSGRAAGPVRALRRRGPGDAAQLAARTGIDARYAREWLEQQAAAGSSTWTMPRAGPTRGGSACPAATPRSSSTPRARTWWPAGALHGHVQRPATPRPLEAATARGAGIDWADYGPDIDRGPGGHQPAPVPALRRRLDRRPARRRRAPAATAAGWRTSPAAPAGHRSGSPAHFPGATVDGIDVDPGSIERATATAAREGMSDRVTFRFADAAGGRRRRVATTWSRSSRRSTT